jgi:small subunit ribosomal protein S9
MAEENEQQQDETRQDETQPEEAPEQESEQGAEEGGGEQPSAPEAPTGPEGAAGEEPEAAAPEAPEPEAAEAAEGPEAAEAGEEPEAAEAPAEPEAPATGTDLPPGAELEPIALEPERELSAEEKARAEAEAEERARREAAATEDAEEPAAAARAPAKLEAGARYLATGKRKRSIARVILTAGEGKVVINERALEEYFPRSQHQVIAKQPLAVSGYEESVDVRVRVHGGGISGQAGAVRHGIARALTEIDGELRQELKRRGLLTRDARAKERRKAGLKKARKRPQFSKR